jgi:Chaperone of endosialidase
MKRRKTKSKGGASGIEVDSTLHLRTYDGWQLLSYDTDPDAGFLFRDAGQQSNQLEILYWQQDAAPSGPQFVLDGETGNLGIGAANPTDKLTISGGALSFQQADQSVPEMGIDYDAASQSLRIRARTGKASALNDDLLTIKQNGEITARGKINAQGGLAVTGLLSAPSITAEGLTGKTITAQEGVNVGSTRLSPTALATERLTVSHVITGTIQVTGAGIEIGDTKLTGRGLVARSLTVSEEVTVGSTKLSSNAISTQKLTVSQEINVGGTKLTATGGIIASSLAADNGQLLISSKGTEQLWLNVGDGGRVMVGSDKAPIIVKGDLQIYKRILLKGEDENHGITHGGAKQFAKQHVDGPIIFGWEGGALGSRDGSTEVIALAWTQKGNVGIGTTKPDGRLEIKGTETDAIIKVGGTNGDAHHLSSARDMVFNSVKGEFFFRRLNDPAQADQTFTQKFANLGKFDTLMTIGAAGDVTIKGKLNQSSSHAFKENISELSAAEAMATLLGLNPVKYDYKDAHSFRQNLGFIAEEMPANLASEDQKSISPFEVIPVLTRVAKEQQRMIAALQETIRTLQAEAPQSDISPPSL